MYEDATMCIEVDEDNYTKKICISRCLRQGYTISSKLFHLALENIITELDWETKGIKIDETY